MKLDLTTMEVDLTPDLNEEDSKKIILEVLNPPSKESIERNNRMLEIRKSITKE